jgi:asparagine synthase (glutamine-hydrolysing)
MCGIAGFVQIRADRAVPEADLAAMLDALAHRGPDGHGTWYERESGVYLGHRRLSIVELSDLGSQPMMSSSNQLVISYNGEVYNYREVRDELSRNGHRFRGGSDTEVLLAAIEQWGLERGISRFTGMFAFALWDRANQTLHLCRDRLGKKPLYFGWVGRRFVFASELSALRRLSGFDNELDHESLRLYLSYSYVPGPRTAYRGIYKLPPGCALSVGLKQLQTVNDRTAPSALIRPYWTVAGAVESGRSRRIADVDDETVLSELEDLLRDAVRIRMHADVPLGAFLSGGVDSSLVVALMQLQASTPVHTFSIGYENKAYDESLAAAAIAKHLGTTHTSLRLEPHEALDAVRLMPKVFDEPFADASQIPTYLVSKLARRDVTVAVSGDGGDEVFAGYTRHIWAPYLWKMITPLPVLLRTAGSRALRSLSPGQWDAIFRVVGPLLSRRLRQRRPGESLHKFADVLSAHSFSEVYERLTQQWPLSSEIASVCSPPAAAISASSADLNHTEQLQLWDQLTYLPDDILVKVDRATMAVSLEARAPLLDHRVVEFAWRMPARFKIRDGATKWALRQILAKYVPAEYLDRPKSGFAVPLDQWLRNELREWAEELLSPASLAATGFLRHEPIRTAWREHLSGRRNLQYLIWPVLMLMAWLEDQRLSRAEMGRTQNVGNATWASRLS